MFEVQSGRKISTSQPRVIDEFAPDSGARRETSFVFQKAFNSLGQYVAKQQKF